MSSNCHAETFLENDEMKNFKLKERLITYLILYLLDVLYKFSIKFNFFLEHTISIY